MIRAFILLLVASFLAGCQHNGPTSIEGGESKVFEPPEYAVLGKTQYDQNWIDNTVEGGVAAFKWPRPKPRPPEFDKAPAPRAVAAPVKKKGFIRRLKERVLPAKKRAWPAATAPVVQSPPPVAAPVAVPPPAAAAPPPPPPPPPPKPRSDLDELLEPTPAPRRVH
jgi:hypothetical protein